MMNAADRVAPRATAQIVSRWTRFGSTSQPNHHSPRKVDSRKNAASPSIASGAPKTSPTKREYSDQFIPNSNSWTRPVTTPMAMLMTRMVPKNRVSRRTSALPERCHHVWSAATSQLRPIVIGTKRKW